MLLSGFNLYLKSLFILIWGSSSIAIITSSLIYFINCNTLLYLFCLYLYWSLSISQSCLPTLYFISIAWHSSYCLKYDWYKFSIQKNSKIWCGRRNKILHFSTKKCLISLFSVWWYSRIYFNYRINGNCL